VDCYIITNSVNATAAPCVEYKLSIDARVDEQTDIVTYDGGFKRG